MDFEILYDGENMLNLALLSIVGTIVMEVLFQLSSVFFSTYSSIWNYSIFEAGFTLFAGYAMTLVAAALAYVVFEELSFKWVFSAGILRFMFASIAVFPVIGKELVSIGHLAGLAIAIFGYAWMLMYEHVTDGFSFNLNTLSIASAFGLVGLAVLNVLGSFELEINLAFLISYGMVVIFLKDMTKIYSRAHWD
ncbi:MAG: hypothetical protein ABEI86_07745, partial [Halobacteriaceae archaeon]